MDGVHQLKNATVYFDMHLIETLSWFQEQKFSSWPYMLIFLTCFFPSSDSSSLSLSHLQPTFLTQWWTIFQQISALGSTMAGPASIMGMSTKWWWALAGTLTTKIPRSPWLVQEKHHSLQAAWYFSLKENVHIANPFMSKRPWW